MRTLVMPALVLATGLALPACSALGLDNLPQSDCVRGSGGVTGDPFCASLATLVPTSDTCHTWQCNESTHHCEQLARDDDGDGAPSMMCAAGATPDCDDTSGTNHPGGTETCDGLDQNCDGVPDDGAIEASETPSSLTTINANALQLALTYQPDADEALLLSRVMNSFHTVTITGAAVPHDLTLSQTGTGAIVPQDTDGAVAALSSQRYGLAVRMTSAGCQQWSLLPFGSSTTAVTLRAIDQSLLPACPGGAQQITAPAIAGNATAGTTMSDTVLVAWLAGADDPRSCGAAPSRTVSVSAAVFNDRTSAANRVSADVITLGDSVDNGPPVVLALGDAFLVAYARADKTIAVHLVTVTVDASAVHVVASTTPAYVEPAGTAVRQGVGLALGPTASGATAIALSYYEACGGSNDITVRMLSRSGSAITGSGTPATGIGSGLARSHVQIAYQPRANEWIVGWRSASGLFVQRLFHDGATAGGAFSVATSATVSAFVLEPLGSGPLYRALVVDGTSLNEVTFGCAPAAP